MSVAGDLIAKFDNRSQVELLAHDLSAYDRAFTEHPELFQLLADMGNGGKLNRFSVLLDLYFRMAANAQGLLLLVEGAHSTPAYAIARAILESLTTLLYVSQHETSELEAWVFLAYSTHNTLKHFAHKPVVVAHHTEILAGIPAEAVALRRARKKERGRARTWSGKSFVEMARAAGMVDYELLWSMLSSEAHGLDLGEHFTVLPNGKRRGWAVERGRSVDIYEIESLANYTRRAMQDGFDIVWQLLGGVAISLQAPIPREWVEKQPKIPKPL